MCRWLASGLILVALSAPVSSRAECGTLNQNDIARKIDFEIGFDGGGLKKLVDGLKLRIALTPGVQRILSDSTQSLVAIEYLICKAQEQQVIARTPEAAECLRSRLHFMATGPKPADVVEWEKLHPPCTVSPATTPVQTGRSAQRKGEPHQSPRAAASQPGQNQLFSVRGNIGTNNVVGNSMTIIYQGVPNPSPDVADGGHTDVGSPPQSSIAGPTPSGFLWVGKSIERLDLEGNKFIRTMPVVPDVIRESARNDEAILRGHSESELNANLLTVVSEDSASCPPDEPRMHGVRVTTGPISFPVKQLAIRIHKSAPTSAPPASSISLVPYHPERDPRWLVYKFGSVEVLYGVIATKPGEPALQLGEVVAVRLCDYDPFVVTGITASHVRLASEFERPPAVIPYWIDNNVETLKVRNSAFYQ